MIKTFWALKAFSLQEFVKSCSVYYWEHLKDKVTYNLVTVDAFLPF